MNSYILMRGLKTLGLRTKEQVKNASILASRLADSGFSVISHANLHFLVINGEPKDLITLTISFPESSSNITHIKQVSTDVYFVMVGIEEDLESLLEKILSHFIV